MLHCLIFACTQPRRRNPFCCLLLLGRLVNLADIFALCAYLTYINVPVGVRLLLTKSGNSWGLYPCCVAMSMDTVKCPKKWICILEIDLWFPREGGSGHTDQGRGGEPKTKCFCVQIMICWNNMCFTPSGAFGTVCHFGSREVWDTSREYMQTSKGLLNWDVDHAF